MIGSTKH